MRLLQLSLKPAQGSPGQELGLPEASRGWAVPSRRPRDPNPRRLPAPSHSRDSLSKTRVRGVLLSTWVAAEPSSFRRDRDMFPEPLGGRSSPGSEEDSLRGIRIDSFKDPPPLTRRRNEGSGRGCPTSATHGVPSLHRLHGGSRKTEWIQVGVLTPGTECCELPPATLAGASDTTPSSGPAYLGAPLSAHPLHWPAIVSPLRKPQPPPRPLCLHPGSVKPASQLQPGESISSRPGSALPLGLCTCLSL